VTRSNENTKVKIPNSFGRRVLILESTGPMQQRDLRAKYSREGGWCHMGALPLGSGS
jgi:hypothetical protein